MTSLPSYVVENTGDAEALAATEWLLTSGDGGFAMGTVLGPMARRYHGVLVAPLRPPVQRLMTLSALAESAIIDPDSPNEQRFDLSCFRFRPGELHPRGDQLLKRFEKDVSCRWYYRFGPVELCKELVLARAGTAAGGGKGGAEHAGGGKGGEGGHAGMMTPTAAMVRYTATVLPGNRPPRLLRLVVRPLVALRDFHGLILRDTARNRFRVEASARLLVVHAPEADLHLAADTGSVTPLEQWWYNFQYDTERERGYDFLEDLFHPGTFTADFSGCTASDGVSPARLTIAAGLRPADPRDFDAVVAANRARLGELITRTRGAEGAKVAASTAAETNMMGGSLDRLVAAADDFVIRRLPPSTGMAGAAGAAAHPAGVAALGGGTHGAAGATGGTGGTGATSPAANFPASIIAGYPWFADWGRDTMISLPGLLLCTGRHEEARSLLLLFSAARGGGPAGSEQSGGLVPNVFDDYTGRPHYNTVDASLWFVHACCRYLAASKDQSTFNKELLPACLDVMHAYRTGTAFSIGADPEDGLIASGDHTTQLTWMDAKRDGVVFTPRHGKAIEINALYYNALRSLAVAAGPHRTGLRNEMTALADKIGPTIATRFWNPQRQCLFDCLTPDHAAPGGWRPSAQVRPNQIFAVSLPHSPLNPSQQQAVVRCVRERLWTRHGLRTLEQGDAGYKGRFEGRMFDRDAAYHNGTAWPWLAGPLAEATLRAGGFSSEARAQARELLAPLLRAMEGGCLGQLAEVYDGDDTAERPQRAAGCPAQAWSIAETLRVSLLIERGE